MNLKDIKLQEAERKLEKLEDVLRLLLVNKDDQQKIVDCKNSIQKQRTIIRNIKGY